MDSEPVEPWPRCSYQASSEQDTKHPRIACLHHRISLLFRPPIRPACFTSPTLQRILLSIVAGAPSINIQEGQRLSPRKHRLLRWSVRWDHIDALLGCPICLSSMATSGRSAMPWVGGLVPVPLMRASAPEESDDQVRGEGGTLPPL